jgi:lysyl-tRNA synthetase class 2
MTEGFEPEEHFAEDRLEKLERLRSEGVNPYPNDFDRDLTIGEYVDRYSDLDEIDDNEDYALAGRVTRLNDIGGLVFADIRDESGEVQVILSEDDTEDYDLIENLDKGDIVGVEGEAVYSNTGELSIHAEDYDFVTKSLNHPPGEMNDKSKVENRAVAMWKPEVRDALNSRFETFSEVRNGLEDRGFTEVDTPVLQNLYGGANAEPFETYAEAKDQDMYLRISPELYLKRMLIGENEKIFEIAKDFRNEDIDTTHHPEFTMLEVYEAFADYEDMMNLTEDLVVDTLEETTEDISSVPFGDEELDFSPGWDRMTMQEGLRTYAGRDVEELDDEELQEVLENEGIELDGGYNRGMAVAELFEEEVEDEITDPIFVIDHPADTTPLCKDHRSKVGNIERFEVLASGIELADGYSELNDPIQQGEHFAKQAQRLEEGDEEAHQMDEEFIEALGYGMPPSGGVGIGMDRLAMFASDSQSIKEVLPFPMTGKGQ